MKDVISVTNSNPHVIYRMQFKQKNDFKSSFMQFPFDISFILCEFPCLKQVKTKVSHCKKCLVSSPNIK